MPKLDRIANTIWRELLSDAERDNPCNQWENLDDLTKEKYRYAAQSAAIIMATT